MNGGSLELDVTNSPKNRNHVEDETKGVLKTMTDVAKLSAYLKTLEEKKTPIS